MDRKKIYALIGSLLIILLVFWYNGYIKLDAPPMEIDVTTVEKGTIQSYIAAAGTLEPIQSKTFTLTSQQTVKEVSIAKGDFVEKDASLLVLETPVSPYSLSTDESIIAPFNGTILELNVKEGDMVPPGLPIMTVADLSSFKLMMNISEFDILKLKEGQHLSVKIDAIEGETFTGKVEQIGLTTINLTTPTGVEKVVQCVGSLEKPIEHNILPGLSANIEILINENATALKIPIISVLQNKDGESYVYIVDADNTLKEQSVITGIYSDLEVEILGGLNEGQMVVTNPTNNLENGQIVTPKITN